MNNLQTLLTELATVAPEICQQLMPTMFKVKIKTGNIIYARNIYADEVESSSHFEDIAWLVYAIETECERLGWKYSYSYNPRKKTYTADIGGLRGSYDSKQQAVLQQFIYRCQREALISG